MHTFCASPIALVGDGKHGKERFAAAAGFKQPAEEAVVHVNFPEASSVLNEAMTSSSRIVGVSASDPGKDAIETLAVKGMGTIDTADMEGLVSTMCASEDSCTVLCVIQEKKLVTVQGQGRNSILRCSAEGQMLSGLTTIPVPESTAPTHSKLELSTTDNFVLVGSTVLLESFSQALLTKVFSEHAEAGSAAVVTALLNKSKAFELEERVHLIVMDVRGWADLHSEAAAPSAKDLEKGMKAAAEGVAKDEENDKKTSPTNKELADGVAAASDGVTKDGKTASSKDEDGTKEGPKEEEIDPNAPWHTKIVGTAKKHWATHKDSIMKFAKSRQKTASKDAKKLQGFFGKCGGGGKGAVLHEDDDLPDVSIPVPAPLDTEKPTLGPEA